MRNVMRNVMFSEGENGGPNWGQLPRDQPLTGAAEKYTYM